VAPGMMANIVIRVRRADHLRLLSGSGPLCSHGIPDFDHRAVSAIEVSSVRPTRTTAGSNAVLQSTVIRRDLSLSFLLRC
jgi:hypothetical protein